MSDYNNLLTQLVQGKAKIQVIRKSYGVKLVTSISRNYPILLR